MLTTPTTPDIAGVSRSHVRLGRVGPYTLGVVHNFPDFVGFLFGNVPLNKHRWTHSPPWRGYGLAIVAHRAIARPFEHIITRNKNIDGFKGNQSRTAP